MSATRNSLGRLVRWRGFGESLANDSLRQCRLEADSAAQCVDLATDAVHALQAQRTELAERPLLDLAMLQEALRIEDAAWRRLEEREALLRMARQDESLARAAHLDARTRTRVATARHDRVVASECEQAEKAAFDRMADVYQATKRERRR
jgi:hypothetical protein